MRESFIMRVLILFATTFCLLGISLQSSAQATTQTFSKLFSLEGTWRMEAKNGALYEAWQKINDSTLQGRTYKIAKADTIVFERVDLVLRDDKIAYIPVVKDQNNQQPVTFTLVSAGSGKYVFENLLHDFPQRVVYELPVNNQLHAWIEGNTAQGFKKVDYNYTRQQP